MNSVLIAAGIYLSARIISFIADELTEAELRKQRELDEEIGRLLAQLSAADTAGDFIGQAQASEEIASKRRELAAYLSNEAQSRTDEVKGLYDEIWESIRRVESAQKSRDLISTPLRRSSLELLQRQLHGAKEKCFAYQKYLELYASEIGKHDKGIPPVFYMRLPRSYPYVGKVIWVDASDASGERLDYEVQGLFNTVIDITDGGSFEYGDVSVLPLMITRVKWKGRGFEGSLEKGAFRTYELANTHLGFSAKVKAIFNNHVVLVYRDSLELFLPERNLIDPNRYPLAFSSLTVYPVWWRYALNPANGKCPVTVSERREDALSSLSFPSFPICFSEEDLDLFSRFYEEKRLQDYDEEFLVGPVGPADVGLKKGSLLKLQFGDIPLFFIEVDEYPERPDVLRFYFRFHSLCTAEEKTFSADDIFVPFDVTFVPYYAGTSSEMIRHYMSIDSLDDIAALIWDLFEEFRIQDQIRTDREGANYFYKWESITSQLISVLEQGDSFTADVKWIGSASYKMGKAKVLNPEDLGAFIAGLSKKMDKALGHKWIPRFFVKDGLDNRFEATVDDNGKGLRIVGRDVKKAFSENLTSIDLYASIRPHAEYQQKTALCQFRIGQVANPSIQAACLNSSTIVSSFSNETEMAPYFNQMLVTNESQRRSVELAYKEKNIFLIQGPPGTGKTTVIRELVEQVLATKPGARVLVVSQANVAVDNALSGLVHRYGEQTVRCGSRNKIQPEFLPLWLETRCQDYVEDLLKRKDGFEDEFFESWYGTIVHDEDGKFGPVLCELIIRSHQLVGATCVGLARKGIGLERAVFDLVIIDEAGKALPAEMLIPLLRAKKAVIIGDQNQLPPVINPILYDEERIDLEERAVSENDLFCHSFFERLYDNAPDSNKVMLDTQFRMPSVIGTAISELFYDGKLKNGVGTDSRPPVLFNSNLSYINFDGNKDYKENSAFSQITNITEVNAVVSLVASILRADPDCSIAVITPYKGQKRFIRNRLVQTGARYLMDRISVDTVDSFQGSEADVVVFCTTRAVKPTAFFRNAKRLNVALSRAKRELIILGRLSYFYRYSKEESCLPALAKYIEKNGNIIKFNHCREINEVYDIQNDYILIDIDEISLPDSFYECDLQEDEIRKMVEEYCESGGFLSPLPVEKTSNGYRLKDGFMQFRAMQRLDLSECLCLVSS